MGERAMHEANRRHWNAAAAAWRAMRDRDQLWRRCPQEPELAFAGEALAMVRAALGDPAGKRACVIGAGDAYAAFALAGMGVAVTATDISERQLEVAAQRASELGQPIAIVRCDAADLSPLPDSAFDLVCSTNGFFVWITNPGQVFRAVSRVLKPGGTYVFYDIHPFQRPWKDQPALEMAKPYWESGPFAEGTPEATAYEAHWTLGDLLNGLADAGLVIRGIAESPAKDSRFWQGHDYLPGTDLSLLDWRTNPRAGLPVWLSVAAQRPRAEGAGT